MGIGAEFHQMVSRNQSGLLISSRRSVRMGQDVWRLPTSNLHEAKRIDGV